MNKRSIHHRLVRLRRVKYAYLLVALLVCGGTFVLAYRYNNLTALRLRDELLRVDKQDGDVESALNKLRHFTYGHMNANLSTGNTGIYPPIQLKYTYERLVEKEQERVDNVNSQFYTEAQLFCEQQVTSTVTINRVPCIQEYLTSHGGVQARQIPDALYKFDFVSPRWSPDLAGWSLIAFGVISIVLVSRISLDMWLRHQLRA